MDWGTQGRSIAGVCVWGQERQEGRKIKSPVPKELQVLLSACDTGQEWPAENRSQTQWKGNMEHKASIYPSIQDGERNQVDAPGALEATD